MSEYQTLPLQVHCPTCGRPITPGVPSSMWPESEHYDPCAYRDCDRGRAPASRALLKSSSGTPATGQPQRTRRQ